MTYDEVLATILTYTTTTNLFLLHAKHLGKTKWWLSLDERVNYEKKKHMTGASRKSRIFIEKLINFQVFFHVLQDHLIVFVIVEAYRA